MFSLVFASLLLASTHAQCPSLPNCSACFNSARCDTCAPGYFVQPNFTCAQICPVNYYASAAPAPPACRLQNVANCETHLLNINQCLLCAVNYWVDGQNLCRAVNVANCASYTRNKNLCIACVNGYGLNAANQCVQQNVPNCMTYSSANVCSACISTHLLVGNTCLAKVDNCAAYVANSNTCSACNQGYDLNQALNQCNIAVASNCLVPSSTPGQCQRCIAGYYVQAGLCLQQNVPQCATHVDNMNQCLTCMANYYVNNFACLAQNVLNCQTYTTNTNMCTFCKNGYFLNQQLNTCPTQSLANCSAYAPNLNVCVQCVVNYQVSNSACVPVVVPGCTAYNSANACTACSQGLYLANPTSPSPTCVSQNLPGCAAFAQNQNVCTACQNMFVLAAGACTAFNDPQCTNNVPNMAQCALCKTLYYPGSNGKCQAQSVANCQTHQANVNLCATCKLNFYLMNGACPATNVANCTAYTPNTNVCTGCSAGNVVVPSSNTCVNASEFYKCTTFGTTTCILCYAGHYPSNGFPCLPQNVPGCLELTPNANTCIKCKPSLIKTAQGACIAPNQPNCSNYQQGTNACTRCVPKYYLNEAGACVLQNVANCKFYVPNANLCFVCNPNYTLVGNVCVFNTYDNSRCTAFTNGVCTACKQFYYLLNGFCTTVTVQACRQYTPNTNWCIKCAEGWKAQNGVCLSDLTNCNLMAGFTCLSCRSGYYMTSDGRCQKQNLPNCIAYLPNVNQCKTCAMGFFLNSDKQCAARNVLNCMTYLDNSNLCAECDEPWALDEFANKCVKSIAVRFCDVYATKFTCQTCMLGTYLKDNECLLVNVLNCETYTINTNTCESCKILHDLDTANNKCTYKPTIDGCKVQVELAKCRQCHDTHYLTSEGAVCSLRDVAYCVKYEKDTNTCTECEVGYLLNLGTNACVLIPITIDNCAAMATETTCAECEEGYYLGPGATTCPARTVEHCEEYVSQTNTCSKCAAPYTLDAANNVCNFEGTPIEGCIIYSGSGCAICDIGYKFENNACTLSTNVILQDASNMLYIHGAAQGFGSGAILFSADIPTGGELNYMVLSFADVDYNLANAFGDNHIEIDANGNPFWGGNPIPSNELNSIFTFRHMGNGEWSIKNSGNQKYLQAAATFSDVEVPFKVSYL